jgi:hypothetical protein
MWATDPSGIDVLTPAGLQEPPIKIAGNGGTGRARSLAKFETQEIGT